MGIALPILAKATGAGNSDDFDVTQGAPATLSAYPSANLGSDTGALVKKNPDNTYDPVPDTGGVAITLRAAHPFVVVHGMGRYRIEYSARAAAIGVTKEQFNR